ncbi:MipA/OmpV family protein [Paucibacter sp. AS339]|uniref:MipA/OmpV family protein n=1 Tax=Paucibacter hankyongi TaxID=3133434 RepID=UPI0030A54755
MRVHLLSPLLALVLGAPSSADPAPAGAAATIAAAPSAPQPASEVDSTDPVANFLKPPVKALLTVLDPEMPHAELVDSDFRYLLGVATQYGPNYWGSKKYDTSIKPMWALRWGKWRISTSGGASLMGFGHAALGPGAGASRDLYNSDSFRFGVSLRLDGGRKVSDEGVTAGLPEVRSTLRGRLYGAYTLAPEWHLSGALGQDLAGRGGGLVGNLDLSHSFYRNSRSELLAGLSLGGGDARYMDSYFGVPEGSAAATRLGRSYRANAGLRELSLNAGYTYAFSQHWLGFASAGFSRLLGPAASSPIIEQTQGYSLGLSLGYRN